MVFFKKNIKMIILVSVTLIITNSMTAFAAYNSIAKDIEYTKKDGTETNVESALNELYSKSDKKLTFVKQSERIMADTITTATTSISLEAGDYIIIGTNKTAEWAAEMTLIGDDSIKLLGTNTFAFWNDDAPSEDGTVNGYRHGRGSARNYVYAVSLSSAKTLTGSVKVVTDGKAYMTANSLRTVAGFSIYKYEQNT